MDETTVPDIPNHSAAFDRFLSFYIHRACHLAQSAELTTALANAIVEWHDLLNEYTKLISFNEQKNG